MRRICFLMERRWFYHLLISITWWWTKGFFSFSFPFCFFFFHLIFSVVQLLLFYFFFCIVFQLFMHTNAHASQIQSKATSFQGCSIADWLRLKFLIAALSHSPHPTFYPSATPFLSLFLMSPHRNMTPDSHPPRTLMIVGWVGKVLSNAFLPWRLLKDKPRMVGVGLESYVIRVELWMDLLII